MARERGSLRHARSVRRNILAFTLNGLFFPGAGRILEAGLLLTWFVTELSDATWLVGLIVPIQYGLALIAQPWIGQYLSGTRRRAPWYTGQALARAGLWCGLGAATSLAYKQPRLLIFLFFTVVLLDAVLAGIGNIAFGDTLARVIPRKLRGRTRGLRGASGAMIAAVVGILMTRVNPPDRDVSVFLWLFAGAGILYGLGGLTFVAIKEPVDTSAAKPAALMPVIRDMWQRDVFRRFVWIQVLLVPAIHILPFMTLLGRRRYSIELDALGMMIIADGVAPLVANLLWGRLADLQSNQWVIRGAALLATVTPSIAIVLSATELVLSRAAVIIIFTALVFVARAAQVGIDLSTKNYILELAPDARRRPLYIGVNDTLIAVPTIALVSAGPIAAAVGFGTLFVGTAVAGACACAVSMRLKAAYAA